MRFEQLTNGNYMMYALLYYDNPHCIDIKEFFEDIKRLHYIRRLFKRYKDDGDLKERLIINHLVVFYNVFEAHAATRILFFKVENEYHPVLKTFLVYLNKISYSYDKHLSLDNIELDEHTIKKLRNLE